MVFYVLLCLPYTFLYFKDQNFTMATSLFTSNHSASFKIFSIYNFSQEDVFTVEAVDLAELQTMEIEHTGKGPGAGWYLEHITVSDMTDGTIREVFPCGRWLDEGEDDGKTCRLLRKMSK